MVSAIIPNLDPHKANRLGGISTILLRKCNPELAPVLSNICLATFYFIACLKSFSVVPVFKNSVEPFDPSNYHPINILSPFGKVLKALIKSKLV